jgi:hypothetical protein
MLLLHAKQEGLYLLKTVVPTAVAAAQVENRTVGSLFSNTLSVSGQDL